MGRGCKVRIVKTGVTHYNPWPLPTLKNLELMAELAMKYGIDAPSILRLLKSAAGLPLSIYIGVKGFGIRSGLRRGGCPCFIFWYLWVFWKLARASSSTTSSGFGGSLGAASPHTTEPGLREEPSPTQPDGFTIHLHHRRKI